MQMCIYNTSQLTYSTKDRSRCRQAVNWDSEDADNKRLSFMMNVDSICGARIAI